MDLDPSPHLITMISAVAMPVLPFELVELLLTYALRKTKLDCLWEPEPIAKVLNAVSRTEMPALTKQILWDFAWIDMDVASRIGDVELLRFMLNWSQRPHGRPLQYTPEAITFASSNGFVHVLQWWFFESGIKICWNAEAVDEASARGHVAVLDWWLKSGLQLKYSEKAMDRASANGHVAVLAWWLKRSQKPKYSDAALFGAAQNGHVDVLRWWENSGLPLWAGQLLVGALHRRNNNEVLEWILGMTRSSGKEATLAGWRNVNDCSIVAGLFTESRMDVLVWASMLDLKLFDSFKRSDYHTLCENVIASGCIASLEWLRQKQWLRSGRTGLGIACKLGLIYVLDYLQGVMAVDILAGHEPHCSCPDVGKPCEKLGDAGWSPYRQATIGGHAQSLTWLLEHDYSVPEDVDFISLSCSSDKLESLKWWCERFPDCPVHEAWLVIAAANRQETSDMLEYLDKRGLVPKPNELDTQSMWGWSLAVVEWWYNRNPELFTRHEFDIYGDGVSGMDCSFDIFMWWVDHGLPMPFSDPADYGDLCQEATNHARLDFMVYCRDRGVIQSPFLDASDVLVCNRKSLRSTAIGFNWWIAQGGAQCHQTGTTKRRVVLDGWCDNVPAILLERLRREGLFSLDTVEWGDESDGCPDGQFLSLDDFARAGDICSLNCIANLRLLVYHSKPECGSARLGTIWDLGSFPKLAMSTLDVVSCSDHLALLEWWKETLPETFVVPRVPIREFKRHWGKQVREWWSATVREHPEFPRVSVHAWWNEDEDDDDYWWDEENAMYCCW